MQLIVEVLTIPIVANVDEYNNKTKHSKTVCIFYGIYCNTPYTNWSIIINLTVIAGCKN